MIKELPLLDHDRVLLLFDYLHAWCATQEEDVSLSITVKMCYFASQLQTFGQLFADAIPNPNGPIQTILAKEPKCYADLQFSCANFEELHEMYCAQSQLFTEDGFQNLYCNNVTIELGDCARIEISRYHIFAKLQQREGLIDFANQLKDFAEVSVMEQSSNQDNV